MYTSRTFSLSQYVWRAVSQRLCLRECTGGGVEEERKVQGFQLEERRGEGERSEGVRDGVREEVME